MLSAARSARALYRLLRIGKRQLRDLRELREPLRLRVVGLAQSIGLPENPRDLIQENKSLNLRAKFKYFRYVIYRNLPIPKVYEEGEKGLE